jgi:putative hydrolase of the HAD superfamily
MKYDAVLFDAADTLFTTQGTVGEIYAEVAQSFGSTASPSEIQQAFVRHFRNSGPISTESEKQWWKDVVHRVFSDVGMIADFDRFFDEVYERFKNSRGWRLFPETRMVLEELQRRGVIMGVISNFDSRVYSVMKSLRIDSFFKTTTISSETGCAKPEPGIFMAAIQDIGVPRQRILYVGDSLVDDYQAGESAGLHTVLIDRAQRYLAIKSVRRISDLREVLDLLAKG